MNNKRIQRMLREVQNFRPSGLYLFAFGLLIIAVIVIFCA